jgi:hypothetical protein
MREVVESGGIGRGIGFEYLLIETGEIPTNLHNTVLAVAVELGLVPALLLGGYLVGTVLSWSFQGQVAREEGPQASLARASVALALLLAVVVSSSVLFSPLFWSMLALTSVSAEEANSSRVPPEVNEASVHEASHRKADSRGTRWPSP